MPGPFYFAWIEGPEDFNPDYHAVEDEIVLSFTVEHDEGDFPSLSIAIRNPRVGLLSRPVWAWLSWDANWGIGVPDYKPLFLGRLIGIPNTINQEIVTLDLIARPKDYAEQRENVAQSLRVEPFWDPVFIAVDKVSDPNTVLESYTRLWHFDRITHIVSASDIIIGEDGTEEFQESEIPYDSVSFQLGQAPFTSVYLEAQVNWKQEFEGSIPIIHQAVRTYTGGSLISSWPKEGASLGGGYFAKVAYAHDLWGNENAYMASFSSSYNNPNDKHVPGDTLSVSQSGTYPIAHRFVAQVLTTQFEFGIGKASSSSTTMYTLEWNVELKLEIGYQAERGRGEVARFLMKSNLQPVLTDGDDVEVKEIKISGNDVALPILDEELPIGNKSRHSYYETDRGQRSLRYLLCLARANLAAAARCVEVSAKIPFERVIELTCRKNATIYDSRLPGGQATGKVKKYSFMCDGNTGEMSGIVTIGSVIGYDGELATANGTPTYVEEGYVDIGYQFYEGVIEILPGSASFTYEVPMFAGEDDGLRWPLKKSQVVVKSKLWNDLDDQNTALISAPIPREDKVALGQTWADGSQEALTRVTQEMLELTLKSRATWFELELLPINRNFTSYYDVSISQLEFPKQIDLEASS